MTSSDPLRTRVNAFFNSHSALHKSWLSTLHELAELSFQEHETSSFIVRTLQLYAPSLNVSAGLPSLPTSVTAVYTPSSATRAPILLRADMDALPLVGKDRAIRRLHAEVHHGCGHDGHMACLLTCAHFLEEWGAPRKVVLFFQPAEERSGKQGSGAFVAVEKGGLLRRVHKDVVAVYAMHAWPGLKLGEYGVGMGVMMGESGRFWITFSGKGGHAAVGSERGGDALLAACGFVTCAQSIVARGVDACESAVVAFTQIKVVGSEGLNVVAGCVKVGGTVRGGREGVVEGVIQQIKRFAKGAGEMYGCESEVWYREGYGVTRNSREWGKVAWKSGERCGGRVHEVGGEGLRASLCAEDFSVLLKERGGAFVWLGVGGNEGLHESGFKFPVEGIWWGGRFFAYLTGEEESGGKGDFETPVV